MFKWDLYSRKLSEFSIWNESLLLKKKSFQKTHSNVWLIVWGIFFLVENSDNKFFSVLLSINQFKRIFNFPKCDADYKTIKILLFASVTTPIMFSLLLLFAFYSLKTIEWTNIMKSWQSHKSWMPNKTANNTIVIRIKSYFNGV